MKFEANKLWAAAVRIVAVAIVISFVVGELVIWRAETLSEMAYSLVILTQALFIGLLLALAYRYWSNLFRFLLSE